MELLVSSRMQHLISDKSDEEKVEETVVEEVITLLSIITRIPEKWSADQLKR